MVEIGTGGEEFVGTGQEEKVVGLVADVDFGGSEA